MFDEKLRAGQAVERLVGDLIFQVYGNVAYNHAKGRADLQGWDIQFCPGPVVNYKIEVKFDRMATNTGNLAIEFYNTKLNKPSGIDATRSDFWVVVLEPFSAYIANVVELKKYIEDNKPVRIVHGGDDNSMMRLYKKDLIIPAVFHPLHIDTLRSLIDDLCLPGHCQSQLQG